MSQKKKKVIYLFIPLILVTGYLALKFWAQEGCLETEITFDESFNTVDFKDEANSAVNHWGDGYITAKIAGIFQQIPTSISFPIWVDMVAYADFDEDGYVDCAGTSYTNYRKIVFLKNKLISGARGFEELSPAIYNEGSYSGRITCLLAGDFNNDEHQDIMYVYSSTGTQNVGTISRLAFFEHRGTNDSNGVPEFNYYNHTSNSTLLSAMQGLGWIATHAAIDIDSDGDLDILFANGYGKVVLLRNDRTKPLSNTSKFTGSTKIDAKSGESGNRWNEKGVSVIGTGDFDRDGDTDIIIGALNWRGLKYYKNDGTGNFTLYKVLGYIGSSPNLHDNTYDGASTAIGVADYDMDGDLDFMLATDNWIPQEEWPPNYYEGPNRTDCGQTHKTGTRIGGSIFYFKNDGIGEFTSTLVQDSQKMLDEGQCAAWDLDFGFPIDFEGDGDMDFIVFDGNQSGFYYFWENVLSNRYNLEGTAVSNNITADAFPPSGIDQSTQSITKVQFSSLSQSVSGSSTGLKVTYYVSNNGGKNWDFYAEFQEGNIHNYTDLPVHKFSTFGADIRWKAVMSAVDDFPNPGDAFHGTSMDTVRIDDIQMKYYYVGMKEYSRTSVAYTSVLDGSEEKKLIIAGTFIYPTWVGHLRAYDLTGLAPSQTPNSVLRIVTRPDLSEPSGRAVLPEGVELLWDAGELLASRAASDRTIYTAVPGGSGLSRLLFNTTAENLEILAPILKDVNNEDEGLINFIRGEGREWKLGDIGHSNPIVVGPPDDAPLLKGSGYLDFMNAKSGRPNVLYVGANDGMLHCFDVLTGRELWGFIPYNLLPKLRNMWAVDPITGSRHFVRDAYVDGTPVVEDIYIDADGDAEKEWITILICGQGQGKGSTIGGGLNYYFALDVTDPENPQPLWEFTDSTMGETWSLPAIGRVDKSGGEASGTWVAFMGSGYDNDPDYTAGNAFYAVDLELGQKIWSCSDPGVDTRTKFGFTWDIENTIPGSPSIADIDQDGKVERVYFADLDGRVWKIDVSVTYTGPDSWSAQKIYEDSRNYPILSRPTVWMKPGVIGAAPRLYFGTGGDDRAPSDGTYSFIALKDGVTPEVEWYIGDRVILGLPESKKTGTFSAGEKVWGDPQLGDFIVYFSTLKGSIESVDPCENIPGIGLIYGRYVETAAGVIIGQTALKVGTEKKESMSLAIKTRAAVTVGERRSTGGTRKREVFVQEYDSTVEKLEQAVLSGLVVRSWREIFRIMK